MGEWMSEETSGQTTTEWVEPEMAAMEQAEMVWKEMEWENLEREEMRREAVEQEEIERKKVAAEGGLLILGIPVFVNDRGFRCLLRAVLDQIGTRCPADLERIRGHVRRIETMRPDEMPSYVRAYYDRPDRPGGADVEPYISVSRPLVEGPRATLVGVLAHEFGHAASTPEDVEARSGLGGEWGSELAADHHAAKWGFGRLLASLRSSRCAAHHGPVPGEEVVVAFGQYRVAWRVTDDRVPVCEGLVR